MRSFFVLAVLAAAISTSAAAQGADGKAVYDANCKKCHHEDGKPSAGIKKMNPKIEEFSAAFFAKKTDAEMLKAIKEGKDKMKPYGEKLSAEEMAAVLKYIKATFK
jgi:cytochrome c553